MSPRDSLTTLELMEINPVRIERIYNDKLGRYDEPIGEQILGVSLGAVTYVTRLHEWTIEHRPAASPIGAGSSTPIVDLLAALSVSCL